MSSSPATRRFRALPGALLSAALVATLLPLAACGKKGDPMPAPRTIPQAATDLKVRQRGLEVVAEFGYPKATVAGLPLQGLDQVTLYALERPVAAPAPAPAPAAGGHFCALDDSIAKKLLGDGPLDYAGGKSSGCQVRNKNKTGAVGSAAGMISFGVFLTANKDFAGERGFVQGDKLACPEKVFEDVSGLADKAFVSIPCWNATNKRGTVVMDKGGKLYFASISAEQALSLDASGAKAALLDVAKAVVTKF